MPRCSMFDCNSIWEFATYGLFYFFTFLSPKTIYVLNSKPSLSLNLVLIFCHLKTNTSGNWQKLFFALKLKLKMPIDTLDLLNNASTTNCFNSASYCLIILNKQCSIIRSVIKIVDKFGHFFAKSWCIKTTLKQFSTHNVVCNTVFKQKHQLNVCDLWNNF